MSRARDRPAPSCTGAGKHRPIVRPALLAAPALLLVLLLVALCAGCTSLPGSNSRDTGASPAPAPAPASWRVTLHQPSAWSDDIVMDTDVYNIGEVVEFTVTNNGDSALECNGSSFAVRYQGGNGMWITRMERDRYDSSGPSVLEPGESTRAYDFVTTGWDPGRYRIVHDCGVAREFLLRDAPAIVPAARATAPAPEVPAAGG